MPSPEMSGYDCFGKYPTKNHQAVAENVCDDCGNQVKCYEYTIKKEKQAVDKVIPECFSNYDSTSHQCVHCGHKGCFDAYRTKRKPDSKITPHCLGNYPRFQEIITVRCCPSCEYLSKCQLFTESRNEQITNQDQVGGDHYRKAEITPWDVWDTWPIEQRIGAYRSNAVKYLMRMGTKDERIQEAKKALHYVQKLIEVLKNA